MFRLITAQVRIHWLLHLIDVDLSDQLLFSHLDQLLDILYDYDLAPGFELMGNPGGFLTDFNNKGEQLFFYKTIKTLKNRYLKRYQKKYL